MTHVQSMEEYGMRNTSYFQNITNLDDLRKQYKILLKKYHPDNGGDEESIKIINVEYEALFNDLRRFDSKGYKSTSNDFKYDYMADTTLRNILESIITMDVNIEVCGSWIWVTGNTYSVRNNLKSKGLRFSKNKKAWYWHDKEFVKFSKKSCSLDFIREKYGSEEIKTYKQKYIGA